MQSLALLLTRLGGAEALCRRLWISRRELEDYLRGSRPVPPSVWQHALDILAGGRCH